MQDIVELDACTEACLLADGTWRIDQWRYFGEESVDRCSVERFDTLGDAIEAYDAHTEGDTRLNFSNWG